MYAKIRAHKSTLQIYSDKLVAEGLVSAEEIEAKKADWRATLEREFDAGQDFRPNKADWLDGQWKDLRAAEADGPRRGVSGVEGGYTGRHRHHAHQGAGRIPRPQDDQAFPRQPAGRG